MLRESWKFCGFSISAKALPYFRYLQLYHIVCFDVIKNFKRNIWFVIFLSLSPSHGIFKYAETLLYKTLIPTTSIEDNQLFEHICFMQKLKHLYIFYRVYHAMSNPTQSILKPSTEWTREWERNSLYHTHVNIVVALLFNAILPHFNALLSYDSSTANKFKLYSSSTFVLLKTYFLLYFIVLTAKCYRV